MPTLRLGHVSKGVRSECQIDLIVPTLLRGHESSKAPSLLGRTLSWLWALRRRSKLRQQVLVEHLMQTNFRAGSEPADLPGQGQSPCNDNVVSLSLS